MVGEVWYWRRMLEERNVAHTGVWEGCMGWRLWNTRWIILYCAAEGYGTGSRAYWAFIAYYANYDMRAKLWEMHRILNSLFTERCALHLNDRIKR